MPERAFIDANVLVYATGGEHALRQPCVEVLKELGRNPGGCWISAEVLQEILHVFVRQGYESRAERTISDLVDLMGAQIASLTVADVMWCLPPRFPPRLQARDRAHLAVMSRLGIFRIISADAAFDSFPGIQRLAPERLSDWRESVFGPG